MTAWRKDAIGVHMYAKVELLLVLDDGLIEARKQHVIVVVKLRLRHHQETVVFSCVAANHRGGEECAMCVGAQHFTVERKLQIDQFLFIPGNVTHICCFKILPKKPTTKIMFLFFARKKNTIFYLCTRKTTSKYLINMAKKLINMIALRVITLAACNNEPVQTTKTETPNPFLSEYTTPFQVPPFDQIKNEHYMPAFEAGIAEQQAEVEAIVNNPETATFENTILPFDKSGQILDRVSNVFFNLNECLTNDDMIAIAEEVLPLLSKHSDAIMMNPKLFERIDYVYQHRNEMGLDDQQIRVVEKYHQDFIRSGAGLPTEKQEELSKINEQLSTLSLQFGNNLLKENSG